MPIRLPERAAAAYAYPLLIKHLLHTPLAAAADQEIVYRDRMRYTYRDFAQRLGRLANALSALGIEAGSTVAVMDWDSHRYLECYFGVPMMGAVLQMVNVRLSVEQMLYTIDHAGAEVLLVHRDFLPILEKLREKATTVRSYVLLQDDPGALPEQPRFAGEYEALLGGAVERFEFADFDENAL